VQWVILSYSSGGRATAEDLSDAIATSGKVLEIEEIDYRKNVMAGGNRHVKGTHLGE